MSDAQAHRYDRPVLVRFGGADITLEPLRGVKALKKFEAAILNEIEGLRARIESHTSGAEQMLAGTGVDETLLLLAGAPDTITPELIENSTPRERLGALVEVCHLNNLGRLAPFLAPEVLLDLAMRISAGKPALPTTESLESSSEPASAGATSRTN